MDEEKLKNLVYQFWAAVIKARNAGDLDWDERFTNFPTACCRDASDLLAKFLYKNGFNTLSVYGDCQGSTHRWLVWDDGKIGPPETWRFEDVVPAEIMPYYESYGSNTRADLVANYIGQTANKTRSVLNRALHGVLFIDEAYSLTNKQRSGGATDYGIEALEEILKFMSDHQNEICVIVAGYKKEMKDFIDANPGLQSRFSTTIEFDDYTEDELYTIFTKLCAANDYIIPDEVKPIIMEQFAQAKASGSQFGNARFVVSYFNDLVGALGDYLIAKYEDFHTVAPSDQELQTFTVELFDHNYRNPKEFRFADLYSVPKQ